MPRLLLERQHLRSLACEVLFPPGAMVSPREEILTPGAASDEEEMSLFLPWKGK